MLKNIEIVGRALADRNRVRVLKLLEAGELCASQITAVLGLAPDTLSEHLWLLKTAGLLTIRRGGRWEYYRLAERPPNAYATVVLDLVRGGLGADPTIAADRARLAQVNAMPLPTPCDQERAAVSRTSGLDLPKGGATLAKRCVAVLVAACLGLYAFRGKVVETYPEAARYYLMAGLIDELVGAGLTFRNTNSERMMQDDTEVLVVRGIIVNTIDRQRDIPLLRLALFAKEQLLQEKLISPPQAALEAHGTVAYRIALERPDRHADRFVVTFAPDTTPPAKP